MSWSTRIADRYGLRLGPDLEAWFDQQRWREAGGADFRRPLTPEQNLDPPQGVLWSGFMLPDTLPLIGNDAGDWLCLRAGEDDGVAEIIRWSHAGGDWLPWGDTLSHSLLFDAAFREQHPWRAAGTPADPATTERSPDDDRFDAARWALRQSSFDATGLPEDWDRPGVDPRRLSGWFVSAGISVIAVRHQTLLSHLDTPLKSSADLKTAEEMGVVWEPEFVRWLFDTALIPVARLDEFERRFHLDFDRLTAQDWLAAEREALSVIAARADLAWSHDIAGWAAERRGDIRAAIDRYRAGLRLSAFSDDTVRFRTHWFPDRYGKFAAARLAALAEHLSDDARQDAYLMLYLNEEEGTLRDRVFRFWLAEAKRSQSDDDPAAAYQAYYQAGWDLGLRDVADYREILDGLTLAARRAGWTARARIAETHLRAL